MLKIRYNMFETNSSSTHSLAIAQNGEIEKLKNNELLVDLYGSSSKYLISYEEALEELMNCLNKYGSEEEKAIAAGNDKEEIYRLLYEYDIAERFDYYVQSEYLEPYEEEFITENGDRILVFGRYGHC